MTNPLVEQVLAGRRRAVARVISLVEDNGGDAQEILAALHPYTGRAHIVGVTGPPGSGKSSLVNALALHFRQNAPDLKPSAVGIIAVDPTSPFTGGAILGDRIRMSDLAGDPGIFIRSMASRGSLGGLAWSTGDAVKVLDAAGYDLVFIETVGAGQAEVNIARTAHTTVVVEVPGLGDDIQAIKAGMLEIADVFAVNKSDHEGADHAVMALRMMLDLGASGDAAGHHRSHSGIASAVMRASGKPGDIPPGTTAGDALPWIPPIHKTVATRREGVSELASSIQQHHTYLRRTGGFAQREWERAAAELETIIQQESLRAILEAAGEDKVAEAISRIVRREIDPFAACQQLLGG